MVSLGDFLPSSTWLSVPIILLAILYVYGTRTHGFLKKLGIPGPSPLPLIGNLHTLFKEGFRCDVRLVKKYGRVFGYYEGVTPVVIFCDPDAIKQVMVKDFDHFVNRRSEFPINDEMRKAITIVNDEEWKSLRNVMTPTFTAGKMKKMAAVVSECCDDLFQNMRKLAQTGEECDVKYICGCFTMDVIARTQFGIAVNSQKEPNNPFVQKARKAFDRFNFGNPAFILTFFFPFLVPVMEKMGISLFDNDTVHFFRDKVYDILRMRENMKEKPIDFLQLMLDAHADESTSTAKEEKLSSMADDTDDVHHHVKKWHVGKRALTRDEILSNALIFFLAGYETTAATMSWMMYVLALHPEVQEKLHEEVKQLMEESKNELTYESVAKMRYLDQVFCETLRLYPPAQRTDRICKIDSEIQGYKIPKGTIVNIGIWAVHYDPEYWPEPEKFDPERFAPENRDKIVPYSYLPFGQGPRNCIGMRLANMEAKMSMARVVQHFVIERSPKTEVPIALRSAGLTAPKNGIWVRFRERV